MVHLNELAPAIVGLAVAASAYIAAHRIAKKPLW
jgi:hypothetical protein